ncbi:MAG: response regulator [Bacteroidales bacterium]|nr:response regulator [Bacteroidales bacterium]MCF8386956.1 response regulator [Bacteroidales bacterium]MCF8398566.1 response regulator [Bacteroidales bacterium]
MSGEKDIALRVLIVEDNKINQKIIKVFVSKLGHESVMAENGKIAVELFEKEKFDCILMDIQMPVMDGMEATRIIRSLEEDLEENEYTPIIAVTASSPFEDQQEFIKAGMDEYIPKPVSLQKLKDALHKVAKKQYSKH